MTTILEQSPLANLRTRLDTHSRLFTHFRNLKNQKFENQYFKLGAKSANFI